MIAAPNIAIQKSPLYPHLYFDYCFLSYSSEFSLVCNLSCLLSPVSFGLTL